MSVAQCHVGTHTMGCNMHTQLAREGRARARLHAKWADHEHEHACCSHHRSYFAQSSRRASGVWGVERGALGTWRGVRPAVGGRLCKCGWAHAKRVDARAVQRSPAPLVATLCRSTTAVNRLLSAQPRGESRERHCNFVSARVKFVFSLS